MGALPEWSLSPIAADPRYRLLKQLSRLLRGRSLYPPSHPQLREASRELMSSLDGLFEGRDEIRIVALDDRLFVDDVRSLEVEMIAHDLRAKLKIQHIELLVLSKGLETHELLALVEGLASGSIPALPHVKTGKIGGGKTSPQDAQSAPAPVDLKPQVEALKGIFEGWDEIQGLVMDQVEHIMRVLEDQLFANQSSLISLASLKSYDEYTYTHAINIAILTMAQAESLGVPKTLIHDFGVAAMLHDIGKTLVPAHILKKAGKLEPHEFEEMKKHPISGSILLLRNPNIPKLASIVAYEHHMLYNVSGYPALPRPRTQHLCSMLTSLSDFYDALRTNRPYQDSRPSEEIITMMEARIGTSFEERLARHFIALIRARTAA
jgi:HD-GYP domain-containing protein (c-di-GMP phosphodiesterase class II)